ncbi:SHOCT domain-containing protein [Natronobacterium gregoryi]|uniref:Membrane protein (DUF2078) n=2 Tax=Natronobacterium gregoryi TaxID=44930 RepID=L0AEI5_NATGS|nr:SHOCT domain-containing protein [Natronobacterium gregoryi]AFZ72318.1 putative membrane protein (DUF2078) [Natronobacterium gregoryi SP2]ELY71741.1 hypothetical protein C490_04632 [Natronobacterium gregoryi SP2]SFJ72064.1 Short C-terminal domain-containing protein [Natronobacterium gregoryi]
MTTARSIDRISAPTAVVIVAVLATFVALAAIETSVAIIVAIFALIFGSETLETLMPEEKEVENADIDESTPIENQTDALERLRTRYAEGELSDAEFERRLEVLVETETVPDVERYLDDSDDGRERDPALDADLE